MHQTLLPVGSCLNVLAQGYNCLLGIVFRCKIWDIWSCRSSRTTLSETGVLFDSPLNIMDDVMDDTTQPGELIDGSFVILDDDATHFDDHIDIATELPAAPFCWFDWWEAYYSCTTNGRTILRVLGKDSIAYMNSVRRYASMLLRISLLLGTRRMTAIVWLSNAKQKVVNGEFMHQRCPLPN